MYFNAEKVAQMSAYLLNERGGHMSYLKLMKMLYLADRKSIDLCNESISGDFHFSMTHGPILSKTYELINGSTKDAAWDAWIAAESNHEVSLKKTIANRDDLDELSDFDIDILREIWRQHGSKTRWEMVEFTHENLPEWKDPGFSSFPIDPRAQLIALGRTPEQAEILKDSMLEKRALSQALQELR